MSTPPNIIAIDPVGFAYRDDARRGGVDIIVSLTKQENVALGSESGSLLDWMHTVLGGMSMLRTGLTVQGTEPTAGDWSQVISAIHYRLLPRLEGIRDAAVRAHADAGASYGDLATAMDEPRSNAQTLRNRVFGKGPTTWETWAREGGPLKKHTDYALYDPTAGAQVGVIRFPFLADALATAINIVTEGEYDGQSVPVLEIREDDRLILTVDEIDRAAEGDSGPYSVQAVFTAGAVTPQGDAPTLPEALLLARDVLATASTFVQILRGRTIVATLADRDRDRIAPATDA